MRSVRPCVTGGRANVGEALPETGRADDEG